MRFSDECHPDSILYSAEPETKKKKSKCFQSFSQQRSKNTPPPGLREPASRCSYPNIFASFCSAAPCHGTSSDALELSRLMLGDSRPFPLDHMDNAKGQAPPTDTPHKLQEQFLCNKDGKDGGCRMINGPFIVDGKQVQYAFWVLVIFSHHDIPTW